MSKLSKKEHLHKISELIKDVKFAMMTTTTHEGHLHACPMTTNSFDLEKKEIWFIGDKQTETVADIERNPQINLAYTCHHDKDYVSINGTAELVDDKAILDKLWSHHYNAFYEHGKDDPNIQLIKVVPNGAEYWLSGNAVVNMFKMTAASVIDGKTAEQLGDNHSVTF
ncbi:pyridoxamine 5'-phosphate oxidase family protein [Psychrobacter sp. I-STPA10]|uniref:pyridoxamine 5'-phosphate oxidase family protein n=1 Tax=Psychrobacter sp. I-STPA10 TaxID=2585769 RepID=UPI001E62BD61|nr:pyridoxamine 5'-phosphate oxidase family protein [Psychrobacter sp. I-STPA10]